MVGSGGGQLGCLRSLLLRSEIPYFETDAETHITVWGSGAAAHFGVSEGEALQTLLLELIGEKSRQSLVQLLGAVAATPLNGDESQRELVQLSPREGRGIPVPVTLAVSVHGNADGNLTGLTFLGQQQQPLGGPLRAASSAAPVPSPIGQGPQLPPPVGGVMAWRCLWGIGQPSFEMRCEKDERLREIVESAVLDKMTTLCTSASKVPFELKEITLENRDGSQQCYSVRGTVTRMPDMFFGAIHCAEGYVVDVTEMRYKIREAENWHDWWKSLGQLEFDFQILIDRQEFRILKAWNTEATFGRDLSGRSLQSLVSASNNCIEAFDQALVNATGIKGQPVTFHSSHRDTNIETVCTIASDPDNPSVLFVGAAISGSTPANSPSKETVHDKGPPIDARRLALLGGMGGLGSLPPRKAPMNGGSPPDNRNPTLTSNFLDMQGRRAGASSLEIYDRTGETPARRDPIAPPAQDRVGLPQAPSKKPPALTSSLLSLGTPGGPLIKSPSRHQQASSAICGARVYPTLLVLRDQEAQEVWRSQELMLAEHLRASDLTTYENALKLCHMPEIYARNLSDRAHDLFVYDATSNDCLQVANMSGTTLQSLQRHCEGQRLLTLVLEPEQDSEDAFEVFPGSSPT